jgi:hypothetical protein
MRRVQAEGRPNEQQGLNPMTKMEMVKEALSQIGEASAQEISTFIESKYGTQIDPAFIPVFRATLKDKERMEKARRRNEATASEKKT